MRSRRAALMLSLALLAGSVVAANLPSAGAAVPGCPCVLLIEVDGLEPKDVTPETTPFLWALAHPDDPGAGQLVEDSRAGWTWEAPRAVMSAGTAANAGALLTGSYPEQHGVPADEFVSPDGTTSRLEHQPPEPIEQIGIAHYETDSLLDLVPTSDEGGIKRGAAAFVGNPALSQIANSGEIAESLKWWPKTGHGDENAEPSTVPSPAYCDVPRRPPEEMSEDETPPCSAPDVVTLDRSLAALNSSTGSNVAFTYIHLAELGVIKRRDGDFTPQAPSLDVDSPAAQESLPHALAQLDFALAQFITRYKDRAQSPTTAQKWEDTFVMVVGSHGYETALQARRLPSPDGTTDLETYVEADGRLQYAPYGSMATIHATDADPEARRQAIESIANKLTQGGPVETQCAAISDGDVSNGEKCIKEVLYVRDDVLPGTTAGDAKRLSQLYPAWHFDHRSLDEPFAPTRQSGELLVITEPGWAAGRALPQPQTEGEEGGSLPISDVADPYLGVAGGPRNRAVAAIVNGPGTGEGVRQVQVPRYPVTASADTGPLQSDPTPKFGSLDEANANPEYDTDEPKYPRPGYERQPESVDFAPTIAALLGIGMESEQLAGRFLQEAFQRTLAFPEDEPPPPPPPTQCADGTDNDGDAKVDLDDPGCASADDDDEYEPPPPPPPPEVIILPPPPVPEPPPPPKQWSYSGLVRNLSAAVGDKRGRIFPRVRRGAELSYLILRADFGKPLASVKLSFYKRQETGDARAARRRTVVKTLASFDPFSIKRAKNAKLTLRVPAVFKPTHVGVVVQQARRLSGREAAVAKRKKLPLFKAYGARKGGIYRINNARRMHTIAPKKPRRR